MQRRAILILGVLALSAGCRGGARHTASRPSDPLSTPLHADAGAADPRFARQGGDVAGGPGRGDFRGAAAGQPVANPSPFGDDRRTSEAFDPVAEHLAQGRAEVSRGNLDQARLHYRRVLQDKPDHVEAHHRLAVIADKRKEFAEAEMHYRAALRVQPKDANLLSDLGYSLWLQGKHPQAEQTLQDALKAEPGHERAINNLGLVYGSQRNYSKALAMFRMTGSEGEAQEKMARLFPNAVPTDGVAMGTDRPTVAGEPPPAAASESTHGAGAGPDLTAQIKQQMDRARREAEIRRRMSHGYAGMAPPRNPAAGEESAGWTDRSPTVIDDPRLADLARAERESGSSAAPYRNLVVAEPGGPSPEPPSMRSAGRPLHPSQINMAFEEIDRSATEGASRRPAARPVESFSDRQSPASSDASPTTNGVWPPEPNGRLTAGNMSEARSLWSPEPRPQEVTAPGSRIERADYHREIDDHRGLPHYEAGPYRRDPAAGGANHAAPGVENRDTAAFRRSQYQSPEEAQREATRIGMDAGPGAPFALIGSEGRSAPPSQPSTPWRQSPGTMTQGAPYGRPVNEMRPTQPGYETPREFVQRESEYGPAERVPAYRPQGDGVSQAGYSRPPVDQATWDGGPGPVPADVHSHDADPGVRHAVGTMEPHQRDRQYHDSELNALMQGLDRERMANQPSRREALPSNQYYTTSDPSLRPYEQMQQRIRPEAGSASARPGMDGAGLAPVWDGSPYGAAPPNNTSPAGPSPWGPRPGSQ